MIINKKDVKSIISKSNLPIAGFTVNPYVGCSHGCKYCYATFMKRFTGHNEEWGTFLDVKYWPEIKNPSKYDSKTIMIGSVTDAYNQYEEKYGRTRDFLKEMSVSKSNLIIITKSDLVLRDIDLISKFNDPLIVFSLNTLNENFKNDMDNAPSIKRRLFALKRVHEKGLRTAIFISPIFPGITDPIEIIEEVNDYTDYIWLENLNLRGSYKNTIMKYVEENYSELLGLYHEIYYDKDMGYWKDLDEEIKEFSQKNNYHYVIDKEPFLKNPLDNPIIINYFYHEKIRQSSKNKK